MADKTQDDNFDPNTADISSNAAPTPPPVNPGPTYFPGTDIATTPGSNGLPIAQNVTQTGTASQVPGQLPSVYPVPAMPPAANVGPGGLGPTSFDQNAANVIGSNQQAAILAQKKADLESHQQQETADLYGQISEDQRQKIADMAHFAKRGEDVHNGNFDVLVKQAIALGAQKRDPNHWWNSKDTGGKIAATAGLMLGGLGQGLMMWGPHGNKNARNYALDAMDTAIKDDIDSQDKNLETKFKSYTAVHDLADNQDNFNKWMLEHKQRQFVLGQEVAKNEVARLAAQHADPQAQIAGQQAVLEIQNRINDERRQMQLHADLQKNAVTSERNAAIKREDELQKEYTKTVTEFSAANPLLSPKQVEDHFASIPRYAKYTEAGRLNKVANDIVGKVLNPDTGKAFASPEEAKNFFTAHPEAIPPGVKTSTTPGAAGKEEPPKPAKVEKTEETTKTKGDVTETTKKTETTNTTPQPATTASPTQQGTPSAPLKANQIPDARRPKRKGKENVPYSTNDSGAVQRPGNLDEFNVEGEEAPPSTPESEQNPVGTSDYNVQATPSPINIAAMLENGTMTPESEAYMRKLGIWTPETDKFLASLGFKKGWFKAKK